MDKRTKILAGVFGAVIAYALLESVVYPRWIEPLLTLQERVVAAEQALDKLEDQDSAVELAKREYRRLAERVGSMELGKVENALRAKLNELITKHKLESAGVSPTRGSTDKTGIERMVVSVTAVGALESIILFMRDVTELPHLIRVGNVTLYPATSSKRNEKTDKVNVRVPIEVVVLPQQRILGERLTDKEFKQPEKLVRHQGRDYSTIWKRTPFTEFVPLPTLNANAGPPQTVTLGQATTVQGGAMGGDGHYQYEWSGPGVSGYVQPSLVVDTSTVGQQSYTLIVRDGSGNSATSNVTITVVEKPPVLATGDEGPKPPPPPPAPTRQTWPDRNVRQLAMTLNGSGGASQKPSVLVVNQSTRQRTFHVVGDDFDGGKLELVDTRGAVVRWEDKFYIYPLGAKLDQDLPPERATGFPELLRAVEQLKLATKSATAPATPEGDNPTGGAGSPNGGELNTPPTMALPPAEAAPVGDPVGVAPMPTESGQVDPANRASPSSDSQQSNAQGPAVQGAVPPSPTPSVVEPARADSNGVPGPQAQAPVVVPEAAKKLVNPRGKKRPSRGQPAAADPAPEQNQNPSGDENAQPENHQK